MAAGEPGIFANTHKRGLKLCWELPVRAVFCVQSVASSRT
jgi:hypothetical protein